MIQIVKSLLGKSNIEYKNELQLILTEDNKNILSNDELDVFKYLNKEFINNKQFPTEEVFLIKFPQYRQQLNEFDAFDTEDHIPFNLDTLLVQVFLIFEERDLKPFLIVESVLISFPS